MSLIALAVAGLAACEQILQVELPGNITETDLDDPGLAKTMIISGIGQYECAFSSFIAGDGGGFADAWHRTIGSQAGYTEYRPRVDEGGCPDDWYVAQQKGRTMLEQAYERISDWTVEEVPDREKLLAQAAIYTGLIYQWMGEVMCEVAVNVGPLMTPEETLMEAEEWFGRGLTHLASTGDFGIAPTASLEQLSYLGRARARWARGDSDGAVEDAARVEPGFIAYITREGSPENRRTVPFVEHNIDGIATIPGKIEWEGQVIPFTGYLDLTIDAQGRTTIDGHAVTNEGVPDPRVPVRQRDTPTFGGILEESFEQMKYPGDDVDQIMAKWAEAQLILAEVDLDNGSIDQAVEKINELRRNNRLGSLPEYTVASPTAEQVRNLIIEERRREFYLEGRFWADKLQRDLWFPRGVGSLQSSPHHPYLTGTCILMPQSEYDLNPNLQG